MTVNEKLIEEAAKAMWAANGPEEWERATGAEKAEHLTLASAALDVFEKAHTPTDDEWEALTWIEDFALNEGVVFSGGPAGSWLPVDKLLDILGEREPQGEPSDAAARALAIHDAWGTPHDPEGKIRPLSDYTNLSASMARELRKGADDV